MRYLSFRILFLCILLPPVMFILSVEAVQRIYIDGRLEGDYRREIESKVLGDTHSLVNGTVNLKDVIHRNIAGILKNKRMVALGVKARITVLTQEGTVLYPPFYEIKDDIMVYDHAQIAARNIKLMQEGLVVKVELVLGYNSLFSILILAAYMSISLCFLYVHYRAGVRRSLAETAEKAKEIDRLEGLEKDHRDRLATLEKDRVQLKERLSRLQKTLETEKAKASRYEEELVEEIVAFEEKIENNLLLHREREEEIAALKERIALFEQDKARDRSQGRREKGSVEKRFKTLYKNLLFHDRAVDGFADITDGMKIKAEEIIRQLNDQPDVVPIKRKVFGKKGRQTVFETVFAYKGRLYFRKIKDGRIEILSIGTKNTQGKDLEFLNNL